jgi:hypothetical protein
MRRSEFFVFPYGNFKITYAVSSVQVQVLGFQVLAFYITYVA